MDSIIKIGFLSTFMLLFLVSIGQIPKVAMEIPVKYITPEEGVSLTLDRDRRVGSYWIVFSDKEGNSTFETPTGYRVKQTIGFLDDFYVADEIQNRVRIIKDPNYKESFSSSAKDCGWIDKGNLLLWSHCLITKAGKVNKKGMVLNTVESLKKDKIEKGDGEDVKYFFDAQLTKESDRSSKIYEILYVYKITDEAILLGKNYITDVFHVREEIFGWVSSKKITIWDHRIAVEPNWKKEAVWERKVKNIAASFFVDMARAKRFRDGYEVSDRFIIWSRDSYDNRPIGDWRRFPLLSYNKETEMIKAGVIDNYSNLYYPSYAPLYIKGLKYPLFNMVLFMTLRELGDLLTKFDALADAYTSSSQRQRLKEVWMEFLQSHLGDNFSREQAENMTLGNINEKLFGLPGNSDFLNIRLADITNPSVMSDSKFYEYIQNIKFKRIEIDKIYNNKYYKYGFYSYDTQYFWISQDLLP